MVKEKRKEFEKQRYHPKVEKRERSRSKEKEFKKERKPTFKFEWDATEDTSD